MKNEKLIHEGQYIAEVIVDLIEDETGWAPYLSINDTEKLDKVRRSLKKSDIKTASSLAKIYTLTPVSA